MTIKILAFVFVVLIIIVTRNCYSRNTELTGKKNIRKNNNINNDIKHRFKIYADGIENKIDAERVEHYFNDNDGIFVKCDYSKGVLALIAKRDIEGSEIEAIAELADIKITKIEEK
ncbi:MAG: hypothetical protein LKJ25_02640 [Clostridia bacterium]|nr:hypothetical protein [Clostridia bacterium]